MPRFLLALLLLATGCAPGAESRTRRLVLAK